MGAALKVLLSVLPALIDLIGKGIDMARDWRIRKAAESAKVEKYKRIDAAIDGGDQS